MTEWQPDGWTYRREFIRCGKPGCWCKNERVSKLLGRSAFGHGPYWYRYRRDGDRMLKRYVGKQAPWEPPAGDELVDQADQPAAADQRADQPAAGAREIPVGDQRGDQPAGAAGALVDPAAEGQP